MQLFLYIIHIEQRAADGGAGNINLPWRVDVMGQRILIVDDHEIVREGIKFLLGRSRPEWKICGEAVDAQQAISAMAELKPDLVVMDISMPGMSGLDAISHLRELGHSCPMLIFTMHESPRLEAETRQAGAQGYVLKSQAARDLVRALDHLLAGGTFFGAPPASERTRDDKPNWGLIFRNGTTFAMA